MMHFLLSSVLQLPLCLCVLLYIEIQLVSSWWRISCCQSMNFSVFWSSSILVHAAVVCQCLNLVLSWFFCCTYISWLHCLFFWCSVIWLTCLTTTTLVLPQEYLHERDLVHGDVAARNVLIQHNFTTKLTGLGGACEMHSRGSFPIRRPTPLKWMAPERLLHLSATSKSDVWVLNSIVLFPH